MVKKFLTIMFASVMAMLAFTAYSNDDEPQGPSGEKMLENIDKIIVFQAEGRGFEPRLPLLERIDNQKVINPFLLYEFFAPLSLYYKLCNCWSIVVPPKNNRYDNNQSRSIKRQTKE